MMSWHLLIAFGLNINTVTWFLIENWLKHHKQRITSREQGERVSEDATGNFGCALSCPPTIRKIELKTSQSLQMVENKQESSQGKRVPRNVWNLVERKKGRVTMERKKEISIFSPQLKQRQYSQRLLSKEQMEQKHSWVLESPPAKYDSAHVHVNMEAVVGLQNKSLNLQWKPSDGRQTLVPSLQMEYALSPFS